MLYMVMQLAANSIARKAAEAAAAEAEALALESKHRWRLFRRAPEPVAVPEAVDEWEA